MATEPRRFHKGISLKPIDLSPATCVLNPTCNINGHLWVSSIGTPCSQQQIHAYLGGALHQVVTTDQKQTLTNKTISCVTITGVFTFEDDELYIVDTTDNTKRIAFDITGTTGVTGTVQSTFTTAKTLVLPNACDTLMGKATTDILTNKTFDANGTGNSISNIENADINACAAIAYTKLAALTSGNILVGNACNKATSVNPSGDVDVSNTGVFSISSGVVVNADVSPCAAIDFVKLATLTSGNILVGNACNKAASVNPSGDIDVSATGVFSISAGVIVNADVSPCAAIDYVKLATLTSGNILVGNACNKAASVNPSGDIDVSNTGVFSITPCVIVNADVATGAAIALTKLAATTASRALVSNACGVISPATTTATEIGYVNGVTSAIQTQICTKANKAGDTFTGNILIDNAKELRFLEADPCGSNYMGFKAPTALTASTTFTLPDGDGTSGQVMQTNGSGTFTWATPASGGTNYITNKGAEINTCGWTGYQDLAGLLPVNGTGCSCLVTSTWTRTTSCPLRGTASYLLTKDAANRQGEGFSYPFTIDRADQASILGISFDYTVASGTYAGSGTASDLIVYIYDVTNSALIQPAGYLIYSATTGLPQHAAMTFQTASNSTSYRLIIHVSSTSASAYTVKFDEFVVGPQIKQYGAPITDPKASTTSLNWTTNTTHTAKEYRIGKYLYLEGNITLAGAPDSATLTLTLPYSIDTTIIDADVDNSIGGYFDYIDAGVRIAPGGKIRYATATTMVFTINNTDVTQASPITWANTDEINYRIKVPIVGWSSNTVMSEQSSNRLVAVRAIKTVAQCAVSGPIKATFGTASACTGFDTAGSFCTTNSRFIAPESGRYVAYAKLYLSAVTADTQNTIALYKNNAVYAIHYERNSGGTDFTFQVSSSFCLIKGDYLEVFVNGDASFNIGSGPTISYFEIHKVVSNQQIAASESINARYYASATSISACFATVSWSTKCYDTHNAMSAGTFTIPSPGKYQVNSGLALSGTFVLNNTTVMQIQKNGAAVTEVTRYIAGAITNDEVQISDQITAIAGDTIRIQVKNSGTTPAIVSSNTKNYFSIARVGN